jgi:hypothetical protein
MTHPIRSGRREGPWWEVHRGQSLLSGKYDSAQPPASATAATGSAAQIIDKH